MASPGGYGGLSWKADLNSGLSKTSRGEITSLRHDNNVLGEAEYGDTIQLSGERKIKSHGELINRYYEDTSFRLNSPIYVSYINRAAEFIDTDKIFSSQPDRDRVYTTRMMPKTRSFESLPFSENLMRCVIKSKRTMICCSFRNVHL